MLLYSDKLKTTINLNNFDYLAIRANASHAFPCSLVVGRYGDKEITIKTFHMSEAQEAKDIYQDILKRWGEIQGIYDLRTTDIDSSRTFTVAETKRL